jgi:hypothetical protein
MLEARGRDADVIREARRGLERFPHAHELAAILRKGFERQDRAQNASTRPASRGDAGLDDLCDVVHSYLAFAKLDEAARAAHDLVSSFPREPKALVSHGLVRKALFQRDHASRDGQAALDSLRRAVELDGGSLEARRGLAETYALIGATSQAVFHALLALEIDPGDAATNRLYRELRRRPLERRSERDLLWEAEVNDQPLADKRMLSADRSYNALLVDGVRQLSVMKSVRRVAMQHKGVAIVASRDRLRPASERSDPFLASVEGIRRGAATWCKRMGMGAFEEATLTLVRSTVLAVAGGGTVIALELDGEHDVSRIADEAHNLVASWTANEAVHPEWLR